MAIPSISIPDPIPDPILDPILDPIRDPNRNPIRDLILDTGMQIQSRRTDFCTVPKIYFVFFYILRIYQLFLICNV